MLEYSDSRTTSALASGNLTERKVFLGKCRSSPVSPVLHTIVYQHYNNIQWIFYILIDHNTSMVYSQSFDSSYGRFTINPFIHDQTKATRFDFLWVNSLMRLRFTHPIGQSFRFGYNTNFPDRTWWEFDRSGDPSHQASLGVSPISQICETSHTTHSIKLLDHTKSCLCISFL